MSVFNYIEVGFMVAMGVAIIVVWLFLRGSK